MYMDKNMAQKDTCTPMFIVALLTVGKTWKQPTGPWTDEQIEMWYTYTVKHYLAIKKNE